MFWAEVNTLRYKPDLQVMDLQDTVGSLMLEDAERLNAQRSMLCDVIYKNKLHSMANKVWSTW